MMLGGGLMMALGALFLLLIIVIPVGLVIVLVGGSAGFLIRRNEPQVVNQQPINTASNPIVRSDQASVAFPRYCAHCGAGLQDGWTHCPQCGAPIS